MVFSCIRLALLVKRRGVGVEGPVDAQKLPTACSHLLPAGTERRCVGGLLGSKAAVTAPSVTRTDGPTAGVRHRPQAGNTARDHDAGGPAQFTLDTHAFGREIGL